MEYHELKITAPSEWEEPLTMLLFEHGAPGVEVDDPAIIAAHLAAKDWDASVFDGQTPKTGRVTLRALFAAEQSLVPLNTALEELSTDLQELAPGPMEISVAPLPKRDWQQLWRESFPTLRLGQKLLIIPAWRGESPLGTELPLYVSPGMAFGTGDHATTALCAELLEKHLLVGQRLLDLGCGSGILAIAGLKLGAAQALAVDNDEICAASIAEHCRLNAIDDAQLGFYCGDILKDRQTQQLCRDFAADLLVSNIVAGVIMELASLAGLIQPGGLWIASGILAEKEEQTRAVLAKNGWQIMERRQEGEWIALVLKEAAR